MTENEQALADAERAAGFPMKCYGNPFQEGWDSNVLVAHVRRLVAENERLKSRVDADARLLLGGPPPEGLKKFVDDQVNSAFSELAALRAENERLRAALKPFACNPFVGSEPDDQIAFGGPMVTIGDYRRAAAELSEGK